jgi:hypothetical protein
MRAFAAGVVLALALAVITGIGLPALNPTVPAAFYSEATYPDAALPVD